VNPSKCTSCAALRLPLVRQIYIRFLSEGNSAGFACGNNFRSKNMEFAVATMAGNGSFLTRCSPRLAFLPRSSGLAF